MAATGSVKNGKQGTVAKTQLAIQVERRQAWRGLARQKGFNQVVEMTIFVF